MAKTIFTKEISKRICEGIMSGKSLAAVCREDGIPTVTTVMSWLSKGSENPEKYIDFNNFLNDYTRARECQADYFVDQVIEIADNCTTESDSINKAKMRIDARKWTAGKMRPHKYGVVKSTAQEVGDAMVEYVTAIKASPNEED